MVSPGGGVAGARAAPNVRGGFSLIEATIAMTISTILVLAVGSVFLAQSDFYARLNGGSEIQEYGRTVVQEIRSAVTGTMPEGLLLAQQTRFAIRRPQSMAVVCGEGRGSQVYAHLSAGSDAVNTDLVAGVGKLDPGTGNWTLNPSNLRVTIGTTAAVGCWDNGTDTTGARGDFITVRNLPSGPRIGDVYMFYEEVEYELKASILQGKIWALHHGEYGGALSELVSGVDSIARFEYRVAGSWRSSVSGGNLASVDAIRVHAAMRARSSGSTDDATFVMVVDIPFREF